MKDYLYTRIALKGNRLYGCTARNRLHMFDLESGKVLKIADIPYVTDFAMGAGIIACAVRTPHSSASQIALLDENLERKSMIDVKASSDLDHVVLSADGTVLAMDGNTLWAWDIETGRLLYKVDNTRSPAGK